MADTKLTAITEITTATNDDLTYLVNDPAGTPVSRKITIQNLNSSLSSLASTVANKTIDADSNTITNIGSSEIKSELITGQTNVTPAGTDSILISDASDSGNLKKALISALPGGGGTSELSDLTDVNTSTPTNRNVLVADGTDWESRALVEADISDLGSYITESKGAFETLSLAQSNDNASANVLFAHKVMSSYTGTVTKLGAYIYSLTGTPTIGMGIYNDSGTLLDSGTVVASATGLVQVTGLTASVTAGDVYWIALVNQTNNATTFVWVTGENDTVFNRTSGPDTTIPGTLPAGTGTGRTYWLSASA